MTWRTIETDRPVCLHVIHSWGGGSAYWLDDFIQADTSRTHLVLQSRGMGWSNGLKLQLSFGTQRLGIRVMLDPIRTTAQRHDEYRAVLHQIIQTYGVKSVTISSLIGHSLDAMNTGLPTQVVVHDFYPYCSALWASFQGKACQSCDPDRLATCLASNPFQMAFGPTGSAHWLKVRDQFVKDLQRPWVQVIAPSRSAAQSFLRLTGVSTTIIPHTSLLTPQPIVPAPLEGDHRLRCLVLGRLDFRKGLDILTEALGRLASHVDLYLLGCGKKAMSLKRKGVHVKASYNRSQLSEELRAIRPHLGLLLSRFPETFSYTLTELWLHAIPPVATEVGAFADRIEDGLNGYLIAPNAKSLIAKLATLQAQPHGLDTIRTHLINHPLTQSNMVSQYLGAMTELRSDYRPIEIDDIVHQELSRFNRVRRWPKLLKEGLEKNTNSG